MAMIRDDHLKTYMFLWCLQEIDRFLEHDPDIIVKKVPKGYPDVTQWYYAQQFSDDDIQDTEAQMLAKYFAKQVVEDFIDKVFLIDADYNYLLLSEFEVHEERQMDILTTKIIFQYGIGSEPISQPEPLKIGPGQFSRSSLGVTGPASGQLQQQQQQQSGLLGQVLGGALGSFGSGGFKK